MTATLAQIEVNVDVDPTAFTVDVPAECQPAEPRRVARRRAARRASVSAASDGGASARGRSRCARTPRSISTCECSARGLMGFTSSGRSSRRWRCTTRSSACRELVPFAIECEAAGVPLDRSNLVWRAAESLWRALRREGPVRDVLVRLHKRIPLQGGLGGGSTDAAATLVALAHAWRVPLRPSQFVDVASTLGADVPFFLSGGTALGLGRGDEIYPLADLPRHWVVLLVPGFGVATVDAYGWYDAERDPARGPMVREAQYVPGSVAVARGADDQRPRGADRAASSRDRADEDRASAGGGAGGRDVGQWVDGVRAVSEAEGRGPGRRTAVRIGLAGHPDRVAGPRRVLAAQPARRAESCPSATSLDYTKGLHHRR